MSETIQGPQAAKGFIAALLNPSSEHALVYAGLVLILLVMTAGLYKIFVPNKGVKVTIYDVQNDGETKDKTRTKIKRSAAVETPDKTINKKKIRFTDTLTRDTNKRTVHRQPRSILSNKKND